MSLILFDIAMLCCPLVVRPKRHNDFTWGQLMITGYITDMYYVELIRLLILTTQREGNVDSTVISVPIALISENSIYYQWTSTTLQLIRIKETSYNKELVTNYKITDTQLSKKKYIT